MDKITINVIIDPELKTVRFEHDKTGELIDPVSVLVQLSGGNMVVEKRVSDKVKSNSLFDRLVFTVVHKLAQPNCCDENERLKVKIKDMTSNEQALRKYQERLRKDVEQYKLAYEVMSDENFQLRLSIRKNKEEYYKEINAMRHEIDELKTK